MKYIEKQLNCTQQFSLASSIGGRTWLGHGHGRCIGRCGVEHSKRQDLGPLDLRPPRLIVIKVHPKKTVRSKHHLRIADLGETKRPEICFINLYYCLIINVFFSATMRKGELKSSTSCRHPEYVVSSALAQETVYVAVHMSRRTTCEIREA